MPRNLLPGGCIYSYATGAHWPVIMRDAQAQIRDTLEYVMASAIPAQYKAVLIEALTQALRNQQDADDRRQSTQAGVAWDAQELVHLKTFLEGKVAKSWQHADELAMHLASQLHRSLGDVRTKAIELGFGASIVYHRAVLADSSAVE